ncbi:hypothetical protein [Streptomyces sp. NPDC058382]|uniref:hypothetical protein n=1 Tax=unclassified Streptomyces TaxID=2593676 RepID=UPI00362B26CD
MRNAPDLSDLASVMRVLMGEPVEALRVGQIFHGQWRSDYKVFVKDWIRRIDVRAGRAVVRFR